MVEVMMILTVLNTAVAVAALVIAVFGRGDGGKIPRSTQNDMGGEAEREERPFKLNDKKMQEGIANLLGYQPVVGGEDE